jgi:hypothetical protein
MALYQEVSGERLAIIPGSEWREAVPLTWKEGEREAGPFTCK